jgi:hypothetical protein
MSESHFYVHLPSDSSLTVYPDNTIAKYVTKLSKNIDLDGEYEVGLSEIIYPTNYFNFDNREKVYKFWIHTETDDVVTKKRLVRSGHYNSVSHFLASFNKQITNELVDKELPTYCIRFVKDEDERLVLMTTSCQRSVSSDEEISFAMSPQLARRLGYNERVDPVPMSKNNRIRAKNSFELDMGKNLMYVYADIISHSIVGDVSAPLLRVCNLPTSSTERSIHLSFTDIHYKPVHKTHFESIAISINTETGELMPFQSGKVLLTLHFRRVHNLPLR